MKIKLLLRITEWKMEPANEIVGQLPEILGKILSYLNCKNLCKAAIVNKLWNAVVTYELEKRRPQMLVMPKPNIADLIESKPFVTVFFVNNRFLRKEDLKNFKKYFPNHLLVVPVRFMTLDERIFFDLSTTRIISLLLPQYRDIKIRVAYDADLPERTWDSHDDTLTQIFVNEFLPIDSQSKATFIIFGHATFNHISILDTLEKKMAERQQNYTVWGAAFSSTPFTRAEFNDPLYGFNTRIRGIFVMSITGAILESWSIVIDCNVQKHELDEKIKDWRSQIVLKRHSIGLLSSSDTSHTLNLHKLNDLTLAVKRNFPGVPLIGLYDDSTQTSCYGLKSKTDDPRQELKHELSFSLMILTYD